MTGASIEPFSLTPAEWLVVFPRPARPPTGVAGVFAHTLWSADDGPADPDEDGLKSDDVEAGIVSSSVSDRASKLREQYPVDRNALEATIKALDATGLRVLVRAVDDLDPIVGPTSLFPVFIAGVMNLSVIGSICVIWGLNDGSFESRQLVGGLVAVILTSFSSFSSESMAAVVQRGSLSDAGSLFRATLEQLVRWQQFGELLEHSSSSSRLLEHVTNDDQCPCKRCLRDLPTRIFWERLLKSVLLPSYSVFCVFTVGWTALVRYGAVFWARCWGVLFGIIFLGSAILCQFLVAAMRNYWFLGSIPLVSLKTRIYHRATSLALRSFLDRAKRDLRTPPPQSTDVTPPGSDLELFVELHTSYTLIWSEAHIGREGKDTYTFFSVTLMPACVVLGTVIILVSSYTWRAFNVSRGLIDGSSRPPVLALSCGISM